MSQNPSKRARHGPADASSSAEATPPDEPATASSSAVATLPDEPAAAVGHSADNTMTEITFVVGGCGRNFDRLSSCEYYNHSNNTWRPLPPLGTCRAHTTAIAADDGKVYVFGGHDGSVALETVEMYDMMTNTWQYMASLKRRRCGCHAVVVEGDPRAVYIVGGDRTVEFGQEDTIERYDIGTNTCELIDTGFPARETPTAAALGDWIYVIGGIPRWSRTDPLKVADRYNWREKRWEVATAMVSPRCTMCAVGAAGKLWVFGGHDGCSELDDVISFDPATGTWTESDFQMTVPRPMASATLISNDQMLIIGGVTPQSVKRDTVELYSISHDIFRPLASMKTARAYAGVGTIIVNLEETNLPEEHGSSWGGRDGEFGIDAKRQQVPLCTRDPRCPKLHRHTGRCKVGTNFLAHDTPKLAQHRIQPTSTDTTTATE